jgi:1-acyl-sn-glycerol-3-phosphate acyltransferase
MIHSIFRPLRGFFMAIFLITNTTFWVIPIYILVILKFILPIKTVRLVLSDLMSLLAQTWAACNSFFANQLMRIDWDIRLPANLDRRGQYLACANHQSWNDIFVLMRAFGYKAPFFKFFLKQELIWVPLLGMAWWGLDFPFMKRHTRAQLAKNPALKGKDMDTTRRACEKFKELPVMVLNFLEGTRFTEKKHAKQHSPYTHLLKPKSGGFAFATSAFGESLNALLDITIVYPDGSVGFWSFLCGDVRRVIVEVREVIIPSEFFAGDYESDAEFRGRYHRWVATLWAEKDARIGELLETARH